MKQSSFDADDPTDYFSQVYRNNPKIRESYMRAMEFNPNDEDDDADLAAEESLGADAMNFSAAALVVGSMANSGSSSAMTASSFPRPAAATAVGGIGFLAPPPNDLTGGSSGSGGLDSSSGNQTPFSEAPRTGSMKSIPSWANANVALDGTFNEKMLAGSISGSNGSPVAMLTGQPRVVDIMARRDRNDYIVFPPLGLEAMRVNLTVKSNCQEYQSRSKQKRRNRILGAVAAVFGIIAVIIGIVVIVLRTK
jgi:hypothetical protein